MRKFLLDDLRDIKANVICRTASAAFVALEKHDPFDLYYFDHDLGETKPGTSGYDVLNWALDNKLIPMGAQVVLVTQNPVGRNNMAAALITNGFSRLGQNFIRRQ